MSTSPQLPPAPAGPSASARTWRPGRPVDLRATLGPLRRGPGDPAYQVDASGGHWLALRTSTGAATLHLRGVAGAGEVVARAWGEAAAEVLDGVPSLLGDGDDPAGFHPRHPLLAEVARRRPGWRVPRTGLVFASLVPAVLEQKVTGTEAWRAWRYLLRRYGSPAPGPAPAALRVPPPGDLWRRVPSWEWHAAGVDGKRARAVMAASTVADRLEECAALDVDAATRRLRAVPGVGEWTAAETRQRALGDADAVSVGDLHLPVVVGWALVGAPLDDAGMLGLMAPYAGHRYRVQRLVELSGVRRPRFAPRFSPRDYRQI